MTCSNCGSERTRRGGSAIWALYLLLIAMALPAVLLFHLHAGLVGAVMICVVLLAHLLMPQRVCLDCGQQWRGGK